jgi:iron complex outermembrane receptor protein
MSVAVGRLKAEPFGWGRAGLEEKHRRRYLVFPIGALLLSANLTLPARADSQAAPPQDVEQIIVTAQKRTQSAGDVGMSITAASAELLRDRGIASVSDLPQLAPGFTVQQSAFNSVSFTLRGVGFFNSDLATPPAVTVYVDEAPLSYPAMTKLAAFDLARVEVLKGPQGTLFGENATGGAVDYIAAKPTDAVESGLDATYGSYNRLQAGSFISGPLNDQFLFRLAAQGERGDAWQDSITRAGDKLGALEQLQGRATLEWRPNPQLTSYLTLTVTHDGSESAAAQFIAARLSIPALAAPGLASFPVVNKPTAADWTTVRPDTGGQFPYRSDTTLYKVDWRADYRMADGLTATALTSYAYFHMAYGQDPSGTPYQIDNVIDRDGKVSSFFQELRLAGQGDRFNWLLGANYAHDDVADKPLEFFGDEDLSHIFESINPQAYGDESQFTSRMRASTYAVFGRAEYQLVDGLKLEGGARFNADRRSFDNCSIAVTDHFTRFWNIFRGGASPLTRIGDCYVLNPADGYRPVTNVHNSLNEDSVSWRVGLDWAARKDLLLYVNASKGYKAGAAPVLAASTTAQFTPVPQESLLAYEAGFKIALLKRRVLVNAAGFYYDYKDKQLRGAELDPTFGPLEALVSIPKSHVEGAEIQLVARPIDGLTIDTGATFVQTAIDRFTGYNALAHFGNQAGTPFPFSPKWQSNTNIDYEFPVVSGVGGFVGGSLTYSSKTYAGVGAQNILRIDAFVVLGVRGGVTFDDGRYRLWVWGKNVTNEYYWNNVFANGDAISRFVAEPATYGLSLSARF